MAMLGEGWMSLVTATVGGALLGLVAATMWWKRRSGRRTRLIVGQTANKIKIYHTHTFCSGRVIWMLAELGAEKDFEVIAYNPERASEDDRTLYQACVHPHGTVPAMVDGSSAAGPGSVMVESAAICMQLAERYGRLLPQPDMLPDYLDWCVYAVATVDPCLNTIYRQIELAPAQQDAVRLDKAFTNADIFARRLDRHLNQRNFICGSTLTAADIVVGYCVMWASVMKGGRIIYDYPNVKSYLARLKARPKFTETMGTPREWNTAPTSKTC